MTDSSPLRILLCYDGSDHARHAAEETAHLFPGSTVEVVTVRAQSWLSPITRAETNLSEDDPLASVIARLDAETLATAEEGAELVRSAGLTATARVAVVEDSLWHKLVDITVEDDFDAVVLGSRGRSNLTTAVLGGVSTGVLSHSKIPVVIVHGKRQ